MAESGVAPGARSWSRIGVFSHERVRYVAGVLLLALLYRGFAELGYQLQFAGPVAAIVWLPVGIGVAFLYLCGLRYWPGVLIGDLLANDYGTLPLGSALGQTTGNLLEVVGITALLWTLAPDGDPLDTVKGVGLMLIAIVAGTTVSATIGSLSLWLGDVIASGDIPRVWRTWWLGDASGALIILPLALAWARPPPSDWWRRRGVEAVLMVLALLALGELALRTSRPLAYLTFPALIWAALRLGRHGATVAIGIAAGFAIWEATRQVGQFAYDSVTSSVLSAQLYIGAAAISTLLLAAVVAERERVTKRLAASRMRLVEAADTERRRIEHNLHDGAQQRLTALVVQLGVFAERVQANPSVAPGLFNDAAQEVMLAIDELRDLAHGIHPAELRDLGLARALQSIALRSMLPITIVEVPDVRVDPIAEAAAYFLVAEALTNTRKHARAEAITLRATVRGDVLRVAIEDDGAGGARTVPGLGLEGMRDRIEAVGGTLLIESPPGVGTQIVAEIPVSPDGASPTLR
jgi:signal transduction histidine kinase